MSTWIGDLGSMVQMPCLSDLTTTPEANLLSFTNLSGVPRFHEVRDSLGRGHWRTWSCQSNAGTPSEWSVLRQFTRVRRLGPHRLITCGAETQNLLTPAQSDFSTGWEVVSGDGTLYVVPQTVDLPDGGQAVVRAQLGTITTTLWTSPVVPVIPGRAVTWPVRYRSTGTTRIRLVWTDAVGATLSSEAWVSGAASPSAYSLLSATAVPPAGAAGARLRLDGAPFIAATNPTWTDAPQPYVDGQGAERVYLSPVSESPVIATPGNSWSSWSYTVREAG